MQKKIFFLLLILLTMLGCATTEIGSAVDRQHKSNKYSNILFISTQSNLIQKEGIEGSFLEASSDLDIKAYISMRILPPIREYTTFEIEEILDRYKIDGILFIALQDYWETYAFIPGRSYVKASASLIGNTLRYSSVTANSPGTMISAPNVIFECRFFDPRIQNFVWRSTSKTSGDPFTDFSMLTSSLSKTTLDKLVQDYILQTRHQADQAARISKAKTEVMISESQAMDVISVAENLFINGKRTEAWINVAALYPKIKDSNIIAGKEKLLARLSFLMGACLFHTNREEAANNCWRDANRNDPEFVPSDIFDREIKIKYIEFVDYLRNEKIRNEEIQRLESVTIRKSDFVRIIKEGAVLRLEPSNESPVIKQLPIGGILKVDGVIEDWIRISLPADKDGISIVGYLHLSFVKKDNQS